MKRKLKGYNTCPPLAWNWSSVALNTNIEPSAPPPLAYQNQIFMNNIRFWITYFPPWIENPIASWKVRRRAEWASSPHSPPSKRSRWIWSTMGNSLQHAALVVFCPVAQVTWRTMAALTWVAARAMETMDKRRPRAIWDDKMRKWVPKVRLEWRKCVQIFAILYSFVIFVRPLRRVHPSLSVHWQWLNILFFWLFSGPVQGTLQSKFQPKGSTNFHAKASQQRWCPGLTFSRWSFTQNLYGNSAGIALSLWVLKVNRI